MDLLSLLAVQWLLPGRGCKGIVPFSFPFQFRVSVNQLLLADSVFTAHAEYSLFALYLMHIFASRNNRTLNSRLFSRRLNYGVSLFFFFCGIRITCPIRKFSALKPGFASQISLADTLYIVVSLYNVSPAWIVWNVSPFWLSFPVGILMVCPA